MPTNEKFLSWVLMIAMWAAVLAAFFGGMTMVVVNKIEQGHIAVRCK